VSPRVCGSLICCKLRLQGSAKRDASGVERDPVMHKPRGRGNSPLDQQGSQAGELIAISNVTPVARRAMHSAMALTRIIADATRTTAVGPIAFSNGSSVAARFMSDIDAFGCLRSLRARAALDGVSWVRSGSVEIAVDRSD
jgi:hypothetical protein